MKEKLKYQKPTMSIALLEIEDIVTLSGGGSEVKQEYEDINGVWGVN